MNDYLITVNNLKACDSNVTVGELQHAQNYSWAPLSTQTNGEVEFTVPTPPMVLSHLE